jgi:holo-[acyl-carrier protein] synthase
MAILGVGTDLVEIDRIRKLRLRHGQRFLDRVFHPDETADCLSRSEPDLHLAGRFAAKEALGKALGTGVFALGPAAVCVKSEPDGRPVLVLEKRALALANERGAVKSHLSISHDGAYAISFVVLECGEDS